MHEQVLKEIIKRRVEILVLFLCPYLSSLVEDLYKKGNIFISSIEFFFKINESGKSLGHIKFKLKRRKISFIICCLLFYLLIVSSFVHCLFCEITQIPL